MSEVKIISMKGIVREGVVDKTMVAPEDVVVVVVFAGRDGASVVVEVVEFNPISNPNRFLFNFSSS